MWYKIVFSAAALLSVVDVIESVSGVTESSQTNFKHSPPSLVNQTSFMYFKNNTGSISRHHIVHYGSENIDSGRCSSVKDCPPWFYCNQTSQQCLCGDIHHNILQCDSTNFKPSSAIRNNYCVTYNEEKNTTEVGACLYNLLKYISHKKDTYYVYSPLPESTKNLSVMCEHFNRAGPLCGACQRNHSPLVYSYQLDCVPCNNADRKNLWKFLAVAFLPLTVFYFVILFFKINVTSSHLRPFVLFSQCISQLTASRVVYLLVRENPTALAQFKFLVTVYGMWNLDFFRALEHDICLNISPLAAIALDYSVAFYPLILVVLSYILIELHDHNCRPIVIIWKPFRCVLTLFRRNWDIRTSVVDAYATFFLLAFMKVLSVSSNLLTPVRVYTLHSNNKVPNASTAVFYDASVTYFSDKHLPYAVLAIVVLVIFVLLPTILLLLYSFTFFQKFLNCFPIRWHILHTFVDSFQGCYKDGTEPGTRDCRWFSALFLLIRIALFSIYCLTLSLYFAVGAMFLTLFVTLHVLVQPYRERVAHYTKIDLVFFLILAAVHVGYAGGMVAAYIQQEFLLAFFVMTSLLLHLPYLYLIGTIIHWLFTRRTWGRECIQNLHAWIKGYRKITNSCHLQGEMEPPFGYVP